MKGLILGSFKSAYAEKLKDPRWQKRRLEILQRDEFTCRDCEATDKTLHVHHCLYRQNLDPWEYRDDELRTLCEDCHEKRGQVEADIKLEFTRLLSLISWDEIEALMPEILRTKEQLDGGGLSIEPAMEREWAADIRWYQIACDDPAFRPAYEKITGHYPKWETLEAREA